MKASPAIALLLAAGFTAGVLHLFGVEFAAGDVYPEYSSLRRDPLGTELLYDSLARLDGIRVSRNYLPLEALRETGATILLLAVDPQALTQDNDAVARLEQVARQGNRVVLGLEVRPEARSESGDALDRAWNIRLGEETDRRRVHHLYIAQARDWSVLDRVGERILAIERDFGKGSVALFAASDDFSNRTTSNTDRLEMVSAALGPYQHIVFDEEHLGIAESGSLVGLARRFHLMGVAAGLGICAGLFLWRGSVVFPPPPATGDPARLAGRTSYAGLLTLLGRHIRPKDLAGACLREWMAGNRRRVPPEMLRECEAAARTGSPLEAIAGVDALLGQTKGTT